MEAAKFHGINIAAQSFVRLVYPFGFDSRNFSGLRAAVAAAEWSPGKHLWEPLHLPQEDLLPHISRHMESSSNPLACAWRATSQALQKNAVFASQQGNWRLATPQREISFLIHDIQLCLFSVGTGFLVFELAPHSEQIVDWLDFLHYARFSGSGKRSRKLRVLRRKEHGHEEEFIPEFFQPHLPQGKPENFRLSVIADAILAGFRAKLPQFSWREVFIPGQFLVYAALFIGSGLKEQVSLARLRQQVLNLFHANEVFAISPQDAADDAPGFLQYQEKQWFFVSLESAGFLAAEYPDSEFYRTTLPDYLRKIYFFLWILSLSQRYILIELSDEVTKSWPSVHTEDPTAHEKNFEQIREKLLFFTARGLFGQIAHKRTHHRFYTLCQQVFQIEPLYTEVKEEITEMHNYVIMQRTRELDIRVGIYGALVGVPTLILSLIDALASVYQVTSAADQVAMWRIFTAVAVPTVIVLLGLFFWRRLKKALRFLWGKIALAKRGMGKSGEET
ncbi:MAG: hypothetical protein NZL89_02695 [Leptospiraceae bacterium]|nr:hypothetical protein [Leptospiraceae bacterium]